MTEAPIKHDAARGVQWTGLAHGVRVGASLLTTTVIAWQIGAAAFGVVVGAMIVVGFLMLLKDLGTGAALVQLKELTPGVVRAVFWTNALIGIAGTGLLFAAAPLVAACFPKIDPLVLTEVLRALSFMLLLAGFGVTHQSLLQRELRFAALARIEITSVLVAAAAGIGAAFAGAGVWALVLQSLLAMGLSTALAVLCHGARPGFGLRLADLRPVARFSLNLTGFNLLNYLVRSADQLLILNVLGDAQAGVYAVATRLLLFPLTGVNAVLAKVLFPLFAKIQDDDARFRNAYLKVVATVATISFPCAVGVAVVAEPLVASCFRPEWREMSALLVALAPVALVQGVLNPVGNIYQAKGRTDLQLRWGLFTGVCAVAAFAIGIHWGALGVAWSYAAVTGFLFVPGTIIPFRLIQARFADQLHALTGPALAAGSMGLVVVLLAELTRGSAPALDLLLRVAIGVGAYLLFCRWFTMPLLRQVRALILRTPA